MPIVYERLALFCEQRQKPMLTQPQKTMLGRKVAYHFRQEHDIEKEVTFTRSEEPDGTYKVKVYPDYFAEQIDSIISKYYFNLSRPHKRKRIKIPAGTSRFFNPSK